MIRLIASDMDGTLLDENGKLPVEFPALLREITGKGIRFVAASGRQNASLAELFRPFPEPVILMSNNGAFIRTAEETILCRSFTKEQRVLTEEIGARMTDGLFIASCPGSAYALRPAGRSVEHYLSEMVPFFEKLQPIDSFDGIDEPIINYSACDFRGSEKHLLPLFEKLKPDLRVTISGDVWLDVSLPDVNKGSGLRAIMKYLGLTSDETAAFGDYLNDTELLAEAKYGFAMENAHPDLLENAGYRAPANSENGVVRTIRRLLDTPGSFDVG
ncbi:MAG: HAD family phosphatase [Clostridiaceae bacterium]|jgi:Cof subfamily protein (haloacid dehalogenase superfamily)|nr:HAD family phosphatase [Clostridiaceae bacterium]